MINVKDFLKCVDINEVIFKINNAEGLYHYYNAEGLYHYYTNDELFYLKIVHMYVDPNDMIMVVAEW